MRKSSLLNGLLCWGLFSLGQAAYANSVQFVYPATFQNPANLTQVPGDRIVAGVIAPIVYDRFEGVITGTRGEVKTSNSLLLPYIMATHRFSSKVVAGLDLSNPVLGYIRWPVDGFQKNFGIDANLLAWELAGKLCVSITDKVAIGVSARYVNMYTAQLNFAVFNSFMMNRGKGATWGGAAGIWYTPTFKDFIDFSYFSPIKMPLPGVSVSGTEVNTTFRFKPFTYLPGTFSLNYVRLVTDKILLNARLMYSVWHVCRELVLKNVAIGNNPVRLPLNWKNSFLAWLFGRFQVTGKSAVMGLLGFDQSLVNSSNNVVGFPIGNVFFFGGGVEYRYAERGSLQGFIGQGRVYRPKIHTGPQSGYVVDGISNAQYTWVDVRSTVDF